MRIPIQYAITHPHRSSGPAPRLDLLEHPQMTFEPPDETRFPAIALARAAGEAGPGVTAALIAADDVAVERFLAGEIGFPGVTRLVARAVERFGVAHAPALDELEGIDAAVRAWARQAAEGAPA
jgi:1-deoxy-D-xylulose-5-phosphate reductoisomerase